MAQARQGYNALSAPPPQPSPTRGSGAHRVCGAGLAQRRGLHAGVCRCRALLAAVPTRGAQGPAQHRRPATRAVGRGAGLLGPAPAPRTAGHLAHLADPLPHRVRLSAVQLCGAGRQSGRLQCRAGAADLRGAEAAVHDPAAPLRHAAAGARREPRRRRHRVARGHARDAPARRLLRSVLSPDRPLRDAAREHVAQRGARGDRGQEDRRGGRHRARAVSQDLLHRGGAQALPQHGGGARGAAQGRGRSAVRRRRRARLLAQRHGLGRLLRLRRRPLHREPLFRRRRRHRGPARQRHAAARVQLGAVPAVGEGPLHRPVAAVFSRSARFDLPITFDV